MVPDKAAKNPLYEIQEEVYQMSSWAELNCAWCGKPRKALTSFCSNCVKDVKSRPATEAMTTDERIAELKSFHEGNGRFLMVPFDVMHQRFEQLMGRGVWTHEFAHFDALVAELEGKQDWSGPIGSLLDIVGEDRAADVIVAQS